MFLTKLRTKAQNTIVDLSKELKRVERELQEKTQECAQLEVSTNNKRLEQIEKDYEKRLKRVESDNDRLRQEIYELRENHRKELEEQKTKILSGEKERIAINVKHMFLEKSAEVNAENIKLRSQVENLEQDLNFYKEKFENGQVAMGFSEIKGMLIAANNNAVGIMKELKNVG